MVGYVFTDENMMVGDFQYEIGKTYEVDTNSNPNDWFRFFNNPVDCGTWANDEGHKRYFRADVMGMTNRGLLVTTNKIRLVEEIDIIEEIYAYAKVNKDFDWSYLSASIQLSEDFIRENKDYVSWYWISLNQKLSEEFIIEFADKVNWNNIVRKQKVSESTVRKFALDTNWKWISHYQKLSEDFIREFADRVDWKSISRFQKLSEDFIREFKNEVDWKWIVKKQKLSNNFIEEFRDYIDDGFIHMKLCDSQISLILYMINFVQYDKEQFQFYMSSMFGKDYSEDEIDSLMEKLRMEINIQRLK